MVAESPAYCHAFRELVVKLAGGRNSLCDMLITEDEWLAVAAGSYTVDQLAWVLAHDPYGLEDLRERLRAANGSGRGRSRAGGRSRAR